MLLLTGAQGAQSELPPSLSGLAWGDAFLIGGGVDAITGEVSSSPLSAIELSEQSAINANIRQVMISNKSEYSKEIEVGAKGSLNIYGVTAEGSASYLSKVQYSSTSLTILAQVEIDQSEYQRVKSPALKPVAQKLLTSDPKKFKSTYGEYFLSGVKKGSTLTVILTCTSTSQETMNDFKSSFSISKTNLFSADGYAKFKDEASNKNVSVYFHAVATGVSGTLPDSQDPETLKKWFLENTSHVSKFAYLSSYSNVDPNFSRDVDIEPAVFARVKALYQKSWALTNRYNTCPVNYKSDFANEYNLLINEIKVSKSQLARNEDKITELDFRMDDLISKIDEVFNRLDLYQNMKALKRAEPKKGSKISSSMGQYFLYGIDKRDKSGINITKRSDRYRQSYKIGYREKVFDFSNDSNALFIGWMMTNSRRDSSNGEFWKVSDEIIGTSQAKVHVKSGYDRGTNWSIDVYQVDKSLYNFENTYEAMMKVTPEI